MELLLDPTTAPVQGVACQPDDLEPVPTGPMILRPLSGKPVDRRDGYRMVTRIAHAAAISQHHCPRSLRHAAITNALDAEVPFWDAQILARQADPQTTEHYDRACGNLDRCGVDFVTAYVAGV